MPARFQFAALKLSEEAQVLIHRLLDSHRGPVYISRAVLKRTGEQISSSSVSRYAEAYRMQKRIKQKGRDRTDRLVRFAAQNATRFPTCFGRHSWKALQKHP